MASTAFRPTQLVSTQSGRKGYQKDAGTCNHNRVLVLDATVKSHALDKHPFGEWHRRATECWQAESAQAVLPVQGLRRDFKERDGR